jgi:hypothetical protein
MTRDRKKVKSVNVYGPDGEFEITSWANAADLVRHLGWTLTKPVEKPSTPTRRKKGADDEPDGAVEVFPHKPNYPRVKKLEKMTRTELLAHVREVYGVELDGNRKTEYMVWWAQQLSTGMASEEVQALMESSFGSGWGIPSFVTPGTDPAANLQFVSDDPSHS